MTTWRFCTIAAVALTAVAVGGCQGNGGAVSVRWRIDNLSTGATFDPMMAAASDGSCCSDVVTGGLCATYSIWVVRSVSVVLQDPTTGQPSGVAPREFLCEKRESTTEFDLPPGTYAIGLEAKVFDGTGAPAPFVVPPPETRTILRGEVVNLQDIEIGVQPLPSAKSVVTF
ncbi:MAG TPA: hypothetical protein VN947_04285 [Polyangia bacterium]|nr:hypothetical protein [Polyangia bacterium]